MIPELYGLTRIVMTLLSVGIIVFVTYLSIREIFFGDKDEIL